MQIEVDKRDVRVLVAALKEADDRAKKALESVRLSALQREGLEARREALCILGALVGEAQANGAQAGS